MKFNLHFVKENKRNPIWAEKQYSIGDTVWIVQNWLIVKCNIIAIEDCFRKKDEHAYLFYDVDEPVGHSLGEDDLFDSEDAAAEELIAHFIDNLKVLIEEEDKTAALGFIDRLSISLEDSRKIVINFIASTHVEDKKKDDMLLREKAGYVFEYFEEVLKEKKRGVDWFSLYDYINLDSVKKFVSNN